MIRIDTRGPDGPEYAAWCRRAAACRDQAIRAWNHKEEIPFTPQLWKKLKDIFLSKAFNSKCAYCESKEGGAFYLHVEHYRPKDAVTEDQTRIDHTGYFWIAYEWWNLVLACPKCNGKKLMEFRIERSRVLAPGPDSAAWQTELEVEGPLLLNPYTDHPEDCIDFDDNGYPYPRNDSPRGRATIDICGLDREDLAEARRRDEANIWAAIFRSPKASLDTEFFGPGANFSLWRNRKAARLLREKLKQIENR